MIEIIGNGEDATRRDLDGRYVFMGLPMSRFRIWTPATPVYVTKSSAMGLTCDTVHVVKGSHGTIEGIERTEHSIRVRHDAVRFVCDTSQEAVRLVEARGAISALVEKLSGRVSDKEIGERIADLFDELTALEDETPSMRA